MFDVAPWAFPVVSLALLVLIPRLIRLVLEKSLSAAKDRQVSVRVRLLLWLRIDIEVAKPPPPVAGLCNPAAEPPP